jgi:hypothetical protein
MTRDVLPGSRSKTYDAQKAFVAAHASRLNLPYEMPDALSAATAILLHHARTGERLYTDDPWTYTRCQEKVGKNDHPVVVGGFSSGGLSVYAATTLSSAATSSVCRVSGSSRYLALGDLVLLALAPWFLALGSLVCVGVSGAAC